MNISQINDQLLKKYSLLIHIENHYSSILNKSLVCFEVKTEQEKKVFEDSFLKIISEEYSDMINKKVNPFVKITFMVVSKEYVDKYCDGILYYAMH